MHREIRSQFRISPLSTQRNGHGSSVHLPAGFLQRGTPRCSGAVRWSAPSFCLAVAESAISTKSTPGKTALVGKIGYEAPGCPCQAWVACDVQIRTNCARIRSRTPVITLEAAHFTQELRSKWLSHVTAFLSTKIPLRTTTDLPESPELAPIWVNKQPSAATQSHTFGLTTLRLADR